MDQAMRALSKTEQLITHALTSYQTSTMQDRHQVGSTLTSDRCVIHIDQPSQAAVLLAISQCSQGQTGGSFIGPAINK